MGLFLKPRTVSAIRSDIEMMNDLEKIGFFLLGSHNIQRGS